MPIRDYVGLSLDIRCIHYESAKRTAYVKSSVIITSFTNK
jgi:hypothetical protein